MSIINVIENLIARFGNWIKSWYASAEDLYTELSDVEKKYATWAYGTVAIVNQNLHAFINKDPAAVALIKQAFPDLDLSTLQGFIDNVLNEFQVKQSEVPLTLEDALSQLATFLNGMGNHNVWSVISQGIGHVLVIMFTPETPVQKLIAIAEYVYQIIVKPKVSGLVVASAAPNHIPNMQNQPIVANVEIIPN